MNSRLYSIKILSFIVTLIWTINSAAQDFIWNTGLNGFFDNREYFNEFITPQTMFGSHIFGYAGAALNNQQEFGAGVDFLYEFGGDVVTNTSFSPILYYHFENKPVNFYLGAFPRRYLADFPIGLQTDTILYYRPNIEGIFVEFRKAWGSHSFWLDWTSRQTDTDRETFQIHGTGKLHINMFFYRHDLLMVHLAGPAVAIPDDHIQDQGGAYARFGIDLSTRVFLDSLSVSTGYIMSYDRLRNVYDLTYYQGSLSEIIIEYRNFGLKNTLYFGDGQAPGIGEAIYEASFYNRTDLYWRVFKASGIDAKIEFSFHIVEDVLDMSQKFTVYATLGGKRKLNRSVKSPNH